MTVRIQQRCVSIGYYREDGDFAVLATLNNIDNFMSDEVFDAFVYETQKAMQECSDLISDGLIAYEDIIVLERQDAPDYVEVDNEAIT